MKNKNPLLVPELREMLAAGESKTLRDFCESGHPAVGVGKFSFPRNAGRVFIPSRKLTTLKKAVPPNRRTDCRYAWNRHSLDRRVAP